MKNLAAILIISAMVAAPVAAASQEQTSRKEVEAMIPALETYVERAMDAWQTPGLAVGIVAEDALVYARGFGVREMGGDAPVDADTVFQIGSTSKAFLATAQALLVDDGRIAWSDPVVDYYPEFRLYDPWVTREFRIDDLLAQRSGLPDSVLSDLMMYGYPADRVIEALQEIPPVTSFRSTYAYQNAFHLVAEKVVAEASDSDTWFGMLQDRVLDPLGMTATSITKEAFVANPNQAFGHRFEDGANVIDQLATFPYNAGGAGGINSSVNDLSRWLRFHMNSGRFEERQLIGPNALRAIYEPRIASNENQLTDQDMVSYAQGWVVHSMPSGRLIDHGGATIGFTAYLGFDPDRRFGVVVLGNQRYSLLDRDASLPARIGQYITDRLQGRPTLDRAGIALAEIHEMERRAEENAVVQPPEIPSLPLNRYAGHYDNPVFGPIEIAAGEEGRLHFSMGPEALPAKLTPLSGHLFEARFPISQKSGEKGEPMINKIRVQFRVDDQGTVEALEWMPFGTGGPPPFLRTGAEGSP